ncbi:MAG TPA: sulfite exporter TauE/SafE family protein [Streptosporangiaceae bacterium]|nr:sulfite exporter TauE/SafE family protein [Streptosporangiaceae bacterium]
MNVDPYIVLGSAVVGLLVGLTGAGGGALMTPMLILVFGVKPSTAISSDLVAAVLMRPVGAAVHLRKGTVNLQLVGWMVLGSVPMAFLGAYLLHLFGNAAAAQNRVEIALGAALLTGAAAMVLRFLLDLRRGEKRMAKVGDVVCRPLPTVLIGMVGGVIVGMTSVGSGSLMIVLLLFLYPVLSAGQLVGNGPDAGRAADACGGARRAGVRPCRVCRNGVDCDRQRPGGPGRLVPVLPRAGPVHQAGHHLRDLRLGPEVRRRRHEHPGLGAVRAPARGRRRLAGPCAAMAQWHPGPGRQLTPRRGRRAGREPSTAGRAVTP